MEQNLTYHVNVYLVQESAKTLGLRTCETYHLRNLDHKIALLRSFRVPENENSFTYLRNKNLHLSMYYQSPNFLLQVEQFQKTTLQILRLINSYPKYVTWGLIILSAYIRYSVHFSHFQSHLSLRDKVYLLAAKLYYN